MKRCTGPCGQVKALDDFSQHARAADGRQSQCKVCQNAEAAARAAQLRAAVLAHYGRTCACCGATDDLEVDHVNGGGRAHRIALFGSGRGSGEQFWRWLIEQGFPEDFQTLCKPCNLSKGDGPACRIDHSAPPGWKRCTGPCGRTLPLVTGFHLDPSKADGRQAWCRDCRNAARRARHAASRAAV